jgi:hypothetical protein
MENEYSEEPEESQGEPVEIYSKLAIRIFAILFSPVFGGVMLMQNLKDAGYRKEGNIVLFSSIAYTVMMMIVINSMPHPNSAVTLFFSVIAAVIMADYVFPKYFPDKDYYPKSVQKPIMIALIICIVFFLLIYYGGGMPAPGVK